MNNEESAVPTEQTHMESPPGKPSSNGAPLKVLLVDDNEDQTSTLQALLELTGYEVRAAGDGRAGLELAATFRPDVAILDIGLPDMDGYDLARAIRANPDLREMFLIAQTGWGQAGDRSAGSPRDSTFTW